jgi:hypothetical protein
MLQHPIPPALAAISPQQAASEISDYLARAQRSRRASRERNR